MYCELTEAVSPLLNAATVDGWFDALGRIGRERGFEYTSFALLMRNGMPSSEVFHVSNYSRTWAKIYDKSHYMQRDPVFRHCLSRTSPLVWDSEQFAEPIGQVIYEQASRFGLRWGVALPIHGPQNEAGMLCFASSDRSETVRAACEHHLPALGLIRDAAFESALPHVGKRLDSFMPKLTPRESECLKWVAYGKSTWEISRILSCSESTVNYHIMNVRSKMGVHSRSAAMMKAISMGLIEMSA